MRRTAVGIIAIALFVGAVSFHFYPPRDAFWTQMEAACWRVGALMGVIWLAYPESENPSRAREEPRKYPNVVK